MTEFHNPYHFVPLPGSEGGPGRTPMPCEGQDLPSQVTHARFVSGTFSGKVVCRLTTVTPLVIGASQNSEEPKKVFPYMVPGTEDPDNPETGIPGIPASGLRGLISSIAEIATHSAFRVLGDRYFSFRRSMAEGLSAMGMVVEMDGHLRIYPLADPHLELVEQGDPADDPEPSHFALEDAIPKNSGDYSEVAKLQLRKAYFGTPHDIRKDMFFDKFKSNSSAFGGPFFALPNNAIAHKIKRQALKDRQTGRVFRTVFFDLGDKSEEPPELWDAAKHHEDTHTRGILRVLGTYPKPDQRNPAATPRSKDREEGMGTRKHEIFLPLSAQDENSLRDGTAVTFPLLPEALERFNHLADERTAEADGKTRAEDLLPFTPHGQQRDWTADPDTTRPRNAYHLKPGDIVFFRPTADGKSIAEVSLSSIWRGRVEKGDEGAKSAATLFDFISSADPDLLPMGDARKRNLTPAELLFGYTEHLGKRALAGRLRFSPATPLPGQGDLLSRDWIDLQVLNTPKPPSPNFYFKRRGSKGHIAKSGLSLEKHQIQGRKMYLHAEKVEQADQPDDGRWTMHTENVRSGEYDRMRVRVRPVLAGKVFEFDIRFDNLSRFELGMLLHALRPSPEFRHKLGMGKPLGLGTIRIEPQHVETLARRKLYAEDCLGSPRSICLATWDAANSTWSGSCADIGATEAATAEILRDFRESVTSDPAHKTVLEALETLGDPGKVRHPVHYPQVDGIHPSAAAFETDRYEWFVSNDGKNTHDHDRQHIGSVTERVPTIKRLPKTERGGGGKNKPRQALQPKRGGHHQNPEWLGPVMVECRPNDRGPGVVFMGADHGRRLFGFLDRDCQAPPFQPGNRYNMKYKVAVNGKTCFFRPA